MDIIGPSWDRDVFFVSALSSTCLRRGGGAVWPTAISTRRATFARRESAVSPKSARCSPT